MYLLVFMNLTQEELFNNEIETDKYMSIFVYNNWKSDKDIMWDEFYGQAWVIKEGKDDEKMTEEKRLCYAA
ncbi:hypothetical protein VNO78_20887 [Psophocarpus tetragonolobus]|uniref:Uncharacterized protein n=1 Tax=Psophocarpus tetragonolobus TaxID=3891 RepID=A0AAN9SE66_PSOTE